MMYATHAEKFFIIKVILTSLWSKAPAIGFVALNLINEPLLAESLGLDSYTSNLEYFLENDDYFPTHIVDTRNEK